MNITLESDYAIRIIHCLVQNSKRMDAKSISEETGVTLRFSLKILRKLVSAGLICSFKGTQGGYELAKKPSEITLNDVIETIEGPFTFCRCVDVGYDCGCQEGTYAGICSFREVFVDISEMVTDKLRSTTFDHF